MPDVRHANLLEPEALVELFLRHPPQGFAAASEADLPVFGTDFDLLTTLEPAILAKIRSFPLFGCGRACCVSRPVSPGPRLPNTRRSQRAWSRASFSTASASAVPPGNPC